MTVCTKHGPAPRAHATAQSVDQWVTTALDKWTEYPAMTLDAAPQTASVTARMAPGPVRPSPYHGVELLTPITGGVLLLVVDIVADIALTGRRLVRAFGLSMGADTTPPLLFGIPAEAVAAAIALSLSATVFGKVILEIRGGSGAARPWGNLPVADRRRILTICKTGIAAAVVAVGAFAVYGFALLAESMDLIDSDLSALIQIGTLPIFFVCYAALLLWRRNVVVRLLRRCPPGDQYPGADRRCPCALGKPRTRPWLD
jgi:hypothetical protein